ncbi:MAG: TetR/AcrR family transcriptional regulator [Actinomycetota bacterium]
MDAVHHRAKPLPPDDRRRAIIDAVTPLLLEKGTAVTSREMAEAAGIAEGTIFRVFPDKRSVIIAAIKATMDPEPISEALGAIPTENPLERQLEAAADVLLDRSARVAALIGALRTAGSTGGKKPAGAQRVVAESNAAVLDSLTELFDRHADRLRVAPARAAFAFRGFIFANAHPMLTAQERPDASEIVDLVLRGVLDAEHSS